MHYRWRNGLLHVSTASGFSWLTVRFAGAWCPMSAPPAATAAALGKQTQVLLVSAW